MAKDKKKKTSDKTDVAKKIAKMAQEAVGVSSSNIAVAMEEAFKQYMRKPLKGDSEIKGRSKFVSNDVQAAVDWATASVVRVIDTSSTPVSFQPNTPSPYDVALAKQMTTVTNNFLKHRTKHAALLHDWVKNGFMTGLGIVMVKFCSEEEESLQQMVKGLTDEALVQIKADEDAGKVTDISVGDPYDPPAKPPQPGMPQQMQAILAVAQQMQPKVRDIKLRRVKKNIDIAIENLPPEDFICSKDAKFCKKTGGIAARLQGHKRTLSRADLIELGHDEDKVNKIPVASDNDSGISLQRSEKTDWDQGTSDVEDDVTVYEIYTKMKLDGDDKARHYRFTLAGDLESEPVLLDTTEVSKYYPYAPFCPYPIPDTFFGQGIADRIGSEQNYISKMKRFVFDNLAMHADPIKIINTDVTNPDDVLNIYPGATVRSSDPTGGISYNQQQFTGGNALSVIQATQGQLDYAVGVGPSMVSVNASDMQNSTATGVSQRANSTQLFMELICRHFADSGYSYLVKLIVDACVSNPEDAQTFIQRLTDNFVPITVDEWDPDMDVSANVAFGVMNKDFNSAALQQLLAMQQQGMAMGFVTEKEIRNTMIKFAENSGFVNTLDFFPDPASIPPKPPAAPPVDPNAAMIEQIKVKGQIDLQIAQNQQQFEERKLNWQNDLDRDKMAQERWLKEAEIAARFHAVVNDQQLAHEQAMTRNDVDIAMAQVDQQSQAMDQLTQIHMAQKQQEQQVQSEAMGHLVQMHQAKQAQAAQAQQQTAPDSATAAPTAPPQADPTDGQQ